MKKYLLFSSLIVMLAIPVFSHAQSWNWQYQYQYPQPIGPNYSGGLQGYSTGIEIRDVNSLAYKLTNLGNLFTYLLVALAFIFIVWHVVIYLMRPGQEDRAKAGWAIFYGIVGLFIIVSIWGLVNILIGTFGTNNRVQVERLPSADFLPR